MREYILSPSLLAADFAALGEEIKKVESAGAKYIHVDVMDGLFVPSISYGMPVIKSIRKETELIFDVHLMITKPERYLKEFKESGADLITVHLETLQNPKDVLAQIRALGAKAGLAVNPETPVEEVYSYLEAADMILVMTVHPGFGGQKYMEECTDKIVQLREEMERRGIEIDIEVDGGIGLENLDRVMAAGANVIVAGSSVYRGDATVNTKAFIERFQKWDCK